jgi:hypothetical protein
VVELLDDLLRVNQPGRVAPNRMRAHRPRVGDFVTVTAAKPDTRNAVSATGLLRPGPEALLTRRTDTGETPDDALQCCHADSQTPGKTPPDATQPRCKTVPASHTPGVVKIHILVAEREVRFLTATATLVALPADSDLTGPTVPGGLTLVVHDRSLLSPVSSVPTVRTDLLRAVSVTVTAPTRLRFGLTTGDAPRVVPEAHCDPSLSPKQPGFRQRRCWTSG